MSLLNRVQIHLINIEIFHRLSGNFDLLVELEESSGDQQIPKDSSSQHHDMSTTFHCNLCNCC